MNMHIYLSDICPPARQMCIVTHQKMQENSNSNFTMSLGYPPRLKMDVVKQKTLIPYSGVIVKKVVLWVRSKIKVKFI